MIKIQHVSKHYRKVDALNDLSLEIAPGSIYGLIGPNGAGKTTLIRILAALLTPSSGEVWFDNEEVGKTPTLIQRKVGYMPDFFGVYPDLTSVEYLEFFAGIHGIARKKQASTVKDLLELVDLTTKGDALVESLSRGMKQRLCLARALVHDPEVLLLMNRPRDSIPAPAWSCANCCGLCRQWARRLLSVRISCWSWRRCVRTSRLCKRAGWWSLGRSNRLRDGWEEGVSLKFACWRASLRRFRYSRMCQGSVTSSVKMETCCKPILLAMTAPCMGYLPY